MKIQNAADATAYSISLLEARDLNFTAYTNRAMMGNEIAIAQLVGLFSWLDMIGSTLRAMELYVVTPVRAATAASLGILSAGLAAVETILRLMQRGVDIVKKALKTLSKIATQAVAAINLAYSYSQLAMHYATVFLTVSVLNEIIGDNAPGAKLSDFGWFALAAHLGTYYSNPLTKKTFVHHNKSSEDDDIGNLMRQQYAATVNGSRDDFSKNRGGGWTFTLLNIPYTPLKAGINLGFAKANIEVGLGFGADLVRLGGTDLRFKEKSDKQYYSWTGVDVIGLKMWLKFVFFARGCVVIPLLFTSIEICATAADVYLDRDKSPPAQFKFFEIAGISLFDFSLDIKPEIDVPFGVGAGQIASSKGIMNAADMYDVDDSEYGGAPGEMPVTYNWPLPVPDWGAPMNMQSPVPSGNSLIYNKHKGLPPFNSVVPLERMDYFKDQHGDTLEFVEQLNFMAPFLVIGLVKEKSDIKTSEDILNTNNSRSTHLDNTLQDGEMAALSKSEVYFSRPGDSLARHFRRVDNKTEYGSTYNPFWQARLVDTDVPDRVIALLFQQKQIWALSGVTLNLPFGLGTFDLNKLLRDLKLI